AALGDRRLPREVPAVRRAPPRPRGSPVRRSRPRLRAALELGAHPVAPPARDQRQDDVPRHHVEVLTMRSAPVAALAALALSAPAVADTLPSGMIGPVVGVRGGLGAVSDEFGTGGLWGIEAGWQPMSPTRRFGFAVRWRTLFSGYWSHEA